MTRKMKDSGIEWIGEIPEEWEVVPNKRIMKKVKNICEIYKDEKVLSLTMNGVIVRDLENPSGKMPLTFDGYQYVEKNNLLMCLFDIDVTPRCIGIIENNGITSPAYSQFELTNDADVKYYYYYYLNLDYTKELLHLAKNLRHSLTEGQLGEVYVPMPSKEEQTQIASYLDNKCTKIDQTIEKEQVAIEKLKEYKQSVITEAVTKGLNPDVPMKDSGVEWIGEIPEHWKITKMQYIGEYKKGPFGSAITLNMFVEKSEDAIKVYEQKNAIYKDAQLGHYYIKKNDFEKLKGFEIKPGDIIVSCAGTIGKCFIMPTNMEKGIINQALMKISLNDNIEKVYFLHLFDIVLGKISEKFSNGSAIKNIPPFSILKKYKIPLPLREEQQQIIDYLDKKCSAIDKLISNKEKVIDKLTEYKKSLIYECVTGKREV